MSHFDHLFQRRLDRLEACGLRRSLISGERLPAGKLRRGGRVLVDVSSNDYLGLSIHPDLAERAGEWAVRYGTGAAASRLVTGSLEPHGALEAKIAAFKGTESALLFASGWQANAAILTALLDRDLVGADPLVFTDRLIHASLHHGLVAAGARQIRYRHNDYEHLEALLRAREGLPGTRFIVTESVFSMDGDRADMAALGRIAERWGAFLYLDEAHATGVLGPGGAGLAGEAGGRVDLIMGTFSKAMGSFGAYVAGSKALCDYLVNRASGFVYSTALPPPVLGAIDAALDLVPQLDEARAGLAAAAAGLRVRLKAEGLDCGHSTTQIVPVLAGTESAALALARELEAAGFVATAIRPPTVPAGSSRIRLALSSLHAEADLARLADAIVSALAQNRLAVATA